MSYFQTFDNITFSDLWQTSESFVQAYKDTGLPQTFTNDDNTTGNYVSDETLSLIWKLMIGRYADSTIKPYNTFGAFQMRFMSRIWQHAPAWKKELDIQNKLRSMSLNDGSPIYEGTKSFYNSAQNPGTPPITEELQYINSQNVTKHRKSKLEGLAILTDLMKKDITEAFLRRFDDFFRNIIFSGRTLLYETVEGD